MGANESKPTTLQILKVKEGTPSHDANLLPFMHFITHVNDMPISTPSDIKRLGELWRSGSLKLGVFDARTRTMKEYDIPSFEGGTSQSLGISVKLYTGDPFVLALRILEICPDSPAMLAGLIERQDWIIGIEGADIHDENELSEYLYRRRGEEVTMLIYNSGMGSIRPVKIIPGMEMMLGCDIGTGIINQIPGDSIDVILDFKGSEKLNLSKSKNILNDVIKQDKTAKEDIKEVAAIKDNIKDDNKMDDVVKKSECQINSSIGIKEEIHESDIIKDEKLIKNRKEFSINDEENKCDNIKGSSKIEDDIICYNTPDANNDLVLDDMNNDPIINTIPEECSVNTPNNNNDPTINTIPEECSVNTPNNNDPIINTIPEECNVNAFNNDNISGEYNGENIPGKYDLPIDDTLNTSLTNDDTTVNHNSDDYAYDDIQDQAASDVLKTTDASSVPDLSYNAELENGTSQYYRGNVDLANLLSELSGAEGIDSDFNLFEDEKADSERQYLSDENEFTNSISDPNGKGVIKKEEYNQ
ncbi:Golgi reassembly-stacking protein 1 [Astathelohania contejeani]|uniref:Golgi reassembly-stacking protein 1 n=1 Tax=Astathelohania contejeani TaxID=164912 RepID=A0ABQ7HWN0_9MICR|nr:Golgi reassembly-stacking protein 1 [Thelohania contejeani]